MRMKRCKKCNSCWYIAKDIQVDIGAHSDMCRVGEKVFGSWGGFLDTEDDVDDTLICPCYKPKPKRTFEGLNLKEFEKVFGDKKEME